MIHTAIIGGGPAGAYCAYCLAEKGIYPVIFDHTHPREKPCGGLISPLAQRLFPFLKQLPIEHSERKRVDFISPSGKLTSIRFRKSKVFGFSRLKFDQHLVNMAVGKGAEMISEKVVALERENSQWRVRTPKQLYQVKILVGADGVNSLVRKKIIGSSNLRNKGTCFGYLVKGLEKEEITIKFSSSRKGYLWIIPRAQSTSVGIGSAEMSHSYELKKELDTFIEQYCPNAKKTSTWAALIPNVKDAQTFQTSLAGNNWILIGDAAGHVDPISGEGISYALMDGKLAAQAIANNNPQLFDALWKEVYGQSLFASIRLRKWIYTKPFLEFYCKCLKFQSIIQP